MMYLRLLLIIFLHIFTVSLHAQKSIAFYRQDIYQAYLSNRLNLWEGVSEQLELEYGRSADIDYLSERISLLYGLTGYFLQLGNKAKASEYVEKLYSGLELMLAQLSKHPSYRAEYYAYMSAYYGYRLTLSPARTPFFGPKSMSMLDRAMGINVNHPLVQNERGNVDANMPAAFGGSVAKAISSYIKSMRLYEERGETKNNWQYLNTMLTLAQSYEKIERYDQAKIVYEKILRIEADFTEVRGKLYPNLIRKIK